MEQSNKKTEYLLKENLKLTRENNKLLKKIRRGNIISAWLRLFLFLIIIGLPFFLYQYYLEDYVVEYQNMYNNLKVELQELKNFSDRLPF